MGEAGVRLRIQPHTGLTLVPLSEIGGAATFQEAARPGSVN